MHRHIILTFGGKEIAFRFGLYFVGELLEQTGKTLEEIMEAMNKNPFKTIPDLMYYSAKYAAERDNKDFTLTNHELAELIDETGGFESDEVSKFLQTFTKSLIKNVPEQKQKKRQPVKK